MENAYESGIDYERYFMILSIYAGILSDLLTNQGNPDSTSKELINEMLQVRQRQKTLHTLASFFFQDEKAQYRPPLQKFFKPLGENNHSAKRPTPTVKLSSVLGSSESSSRDSFDPLNQIENYFSVTNDYSSVSALAPLCVPMSLPSGFVHARSLIERIRISKEASNLFHSKMK